MLFDLYAKPLPPTTIASGIPVKAAGPCKVTDCFTDQRIFRHPDFFYVRDLIFPAVEAGSAVTYDFANGMKIWEMAQFVLNERTTNLRDLELLLIKGGKTFSPRQVEELAIRFEEGDTSSQLFSEVFHLNFFFVHDEEKRVFILVIWKLETRWSITSRRFEDSGGDGAHYRLVTRT